jgi:molybdate transport repressor ModE-like protein
MQSHLSVDDLRLLAALAEAGSLSGAARRLQLDHSSAWRRLGQLEQRLGVRLFERGRAGYAPTSAGEDAVATAMRLLQDIGDLERRLAGEDVRPSGVVRITTTDTLVGLLTPVMVGFQAAFPAIVVELATANVFFTLTKRDADVAIRPAVTAPEGLVARRIATVGTAIYGARGRVGGGTALPERDWVAPDETLGHLRSARWIAANVPAERIVFRASSLLGLAAACRAGLGLAALPCFLADPDPELERLGPPMAEMEAALWLITHPDLRRTARVRAFLDFAAQHLSSLRGRLEGTASAAGGSPPPCVPPTR